MMDIGSLFAQVLSGVWIVFVPVGVAALVAIMGYVVIQSRRSPLATVGYGCPKRTSPAVAGWAAPAETHRMAAQSRHDYALRAGLKRWDGVSAEARSQHVREAVHPAGGRR
jgi:hypothetical protein